MPKLLKSEYEKATTEFGTEVLDKCRNELHALLEIVVTRCKLSDNDSILAVRDALQMLVAASVDLRSAKLQAELDALSSQLSRR